MSILLYYGWIFRKLRILNESLRCRLTRFLNYFLEINTIF